MWYLCEKFDEGGILLPKSLEKRTEVNCWLMFQMGGLGPMQGQAHHFIKVCAVHSFPSVCLSPLRVLESPQCA